MIPNYLLKHSKLFLLAALLMLAHFTMAQCPQVANAEITITPVKCFNDANGSIRIVVKDSAAYKGVTVSFILRRFIAGVGSNFATRPKGLPYNHTFTGLPAGTYELRVTTTPTVVTPCPAAASNFLALYGGQNTFNVTSPVSAFAGFEQYICDSSYTVMGADDPAPSGVPASSGKWTVITGPNTPTFSDDTDPYTIVNGLVHGDYDFRWTLFKTGCPDQTNDVAIRKRTAPVANAGTDTTVCALTSVNLKGNNLGSLYLGTWEQSSGAATTIASPSSNTTTASGLSAGVYKYQWIIQDDLGVCYPDTDEVVVTNNVLPTAFTASLSPNPVCEDKSVTFSLNPVTATNTYVWSGPNGFTFTHTGAQPLPSIAKAALTNAGSYSVVASLNGCSSSAVSAGNLTVNPKPAKSTITASANPICQGQTLTLTAATASPVTWTLPNATTSSANPLSIPTIQTTNAGKYKVSVSSGLCSSDPDSVTIAVTTITTPTIAQSGAGSYCSGSAFSLTANPNIVGATYTWTTPSGSTVLGRTLSVASSSATDGGTYSVTITANACTGPAATSSVTITSTPAQPSSITGSASVCRGVSNLDYSVTPVAGVTYAWSYTGGTGVTITGTTDAVKLSFSATATSGVLTVRAIAGACSSAVRTLNITVNPLPATPAPTSNSPVCAGQTINLSTATVGTATYAWTGPNGFTSTLQNPTIANATAANAGAYSVTVTVGTCSSVAGTVSVVVNPIFTPTASSNSPICAGTALNLTASPVAGATYAWTGPNGFTSTLQNPTIALATVAATGTYSVTATVAGCAGTAGTTAVTVTALPSAPTASSNSPVCAGGTLNLASSTVAGATYAWTGPNGFTSTSQNPSIASITASGAGSYSVTARVGSCTSTAGTTTVVVNALPATPTASSNTPVCAGSTLNLAASTVAGATYAWTGPNSFTSTLQNPTIANVTTAASGTYSVTTTIGSCTGVAATATVVINALPTTPTVSSNSPVCTGTALNLTASTIAGATYTWTGPNGFTSTLQNPTIASATAAAAGTYSVIARIGTCNSVAGTTTVVVNTTPTAATASSNTPLCAGSTLNLTATNVTGANYSWTGPNGFTSTLQNPIIAAVTTAASGTYSVTATVSGCTSVATTTTVVVNPTPATPTASSNTPVCVGSPLNLTAATVAGATYAWTGPNSFTSTLQNPTIVSATVAAAGTYSVTARVGTCTSAASTTIVVVNTLPVAPTVSSNTPVCVGGTLNLTASAVAGATYAWTGPNSFTSTSQNPTVASVTASAAGTYSVVARVGTCNSPAATTTVVINALPATPTASSNSPICVGSTLNLAAGTVAGATYAWTGPNSFTSTSQNPTLASATAAAAGTYSVTATVGTCTSLAGTTTVVVNPQPAAPTASSNSPVCLGSALNLTTPTVAGATYAWTGPNGFTSTLQNPSIASTTAAAAGTYSVTTTVASCTSAVGTTTVVITTLPTAPTVSSNTPVCVGGTLNLTASAVAGATYAWTGPNSFTSTSQNPTVASVTASAAGTYSVVARVGTCNSPAATTTVVINALPATPTASSNSPICVGSTLNLAAGTVAGATYAWTGPNSFTSTSQNPTLASATAAAAGTYSVTATVGTCTSLAGTTTVVVNPQPAAPTASSNSPVCLGSALNLTTPTVAGATYAWTGPNGFTSTLQNPSIASTTAAAAGTYSVTTTVASCTSAVGTTTVVITTLPTAPTVSSNTPVCVGGTLNLTASAVAGATYAWTGPNSFTSTSQNPTVASVTASAAGTYSVVARVGTCNSPAATTTVVINALPATPTASSNSPICVGSTLNLAAGTVAGATYAWTGPNSFTSTSQNPTLASATAAAAGTYSVTATVGTCTSLAGTTTVVVNPQPAAPTASSNSPVCLGSALNLTTPTVAGATYAWTGPNGFTSTLQNPSIASTTATAAGTYSVTTTVASCTSAVGTTTVTVTPLPAAPIASSDSPICQGATLHLSANNIPTASYTWTGPNGFTSTSHNPTIPSVTLAASGTYSVTATVGACTSLPSTTTVVINALPAAPTASSNSPICEGSTLNLAAGTVAGATYAWTGPNGFTSTSQNPTLASATAAAAGTYNVTATVGTCTSLAGTTTVVVNTQPATPTVTSNSPVCIGSALNLTTPTVVGATYAWTGPNGFTSTSQNPTIAATTAAAAGTYSVTTTVASCTSAVGTTTVVITTLPTAPTASSSTPVCVGGTLNLTASTVAGATYAWTGPNGFTSASQNPTISSVTAAAAGTYNVTATVGSCTSVAGTATVVVNSLPATPTASSNMPVCVGSTLNLSATPIAGATYSWTGPNGFTASIQNPSIASVTAAANGPYTVTATVGGCTSNVGTTNVVIAPIPTQPSTITGNTPVCQGASNQIYTVTNDPSVTYLWSYTGSGASITGTSNSISVNYSATATNGNLTVTAVSGACSSAVSSLAITLNPIPTAPAAASNSPICANNTLNLTASTVAGATYAWTGPNGFVSAVQNPTIASPTTAASGTYSVTATVAGCTSLANTTTVLVNTVPSTPGTINGSAMVCQSQSNVLYNITNQAGVTYTWTYSGTGATIFGSTNVVRLTFSPSATSGTLSVTATAGACTSTASIKTITVNPAPTIPVLDSSSSPLCVGQDLYLSVKTQGAGISFNWTLPDLSTFIGEQFIQPGVTVADQGNYLVTAFSGTCLSPVLTIPVSVVPGFVPIATNNGPVCEGGSLTVSAAGTLPPGATYTWTGPNGFANTNQSFTLTNVVLKDSGSYTVVAHSGSCSSNPVSTSVKINPVPAAPGTITGNSSACQNSINTYSITSTTGVIYTWSYSGTGASFPSGNTGSSVNVLFASNATSGNLQVVAISNACSSAVSTQAILIKTAPTTPTSSSNLTVCQGQNINLTASSIPSATYAWTGPNAFTSTLQNPSFASVASSSGTYVVTYSLNGCDGDKDTTIVTVNPVPDATFGYPSSAYCQSEPTASPVTVPAGSSFLSAPSGLSLNSSTGAINFTSSTAGTYVITNIISNGTGCSDTATFSVSVLTAPKARTFTYPSPICNGSAVSVSPSFTSLGDAGTFSSTSGLVIDPTTGAITPSGSTNAMYHVIYLATAGTCIDSTSADVTILLSPNKPTLSGSTTACQGNTSTLTASLAGFSSFDWYKDGSLVQTGGTTFAASTAGAYYVNVTASNGCASPNSDTTSFSIVAKPAVPVINGVCTVSAPPVTLSTQYSSTPGYTYEWFRNNAFAGTASTQVASSLGLYKTIVTETTTGCTSDTSASVNPFGTSTTISIISGTNPFCSGDSLRLSSNSPSGNVWTLDGATLATTPTVLVKASGKLLLVVTNGTCSGKDSLDIVVNPSPSKPVVTSASDSLCAGDSLTLATTATGTLQWTLNGVNVTGATSSILKVGQAGAYQVAVSNGTCGATSNAKNVGVKPLPTQPVLNLSGAQQICNGDSLKLTVTNFTSGTDQWFSSGSPVAAPKGTAQDLYASVAGTYKVIRTSLRGCQSVSNSVDLTVNPSSAPTVSLTPSVTVATCQNTSIRYAASVINAGSSPTYQWFINDKLVASGTTASLVIDTLTQTSEVKVTVTSSSSCALPKTKSDSITTIVVPRFKVATTVKPLGCSVSVTGSIDFVVTSGSGNYLFAGDLTSDKNTVTVAKTYNVTIFDNDTQCQLDTAITVGKATKFTVSAVLTQPTCFNANGSVDVTASPSATYTVTAGSLVLGPNANLNAGTYPISIANQTTGCSVDTSFTLAPSGIFTTAIGITQPDCGQNNGAVTITPSPAGTYTYFGDFNQAVNNNVSPNTYIVNTSNGTCTKTDTIVVPGKALFEIAAAITAPTCTNPLGSIALGTNPAVGFTVSGDLTSIVNNNLAAGTYNVRLTDNTTGCFKDTSFVLQQKRDFDAVFALTNPRCFNKNGAVRIELTPDTAVYQITGNLVVGNNTRLDEGTYSFRAVRLSSNCILDTTLTLVSQGKFSTSIAVTQPDCGVNNGTVSITALPGTGTYTFSGDLTAAVTNNLSPNTYIVETSNGTCLKNDTVQVTGKPSFQVEAEIVQPTCQAAGSIKIKTVPVIDFSVGKDLAAADNTNLPEGTYNVRITDKTTGCFKDTSFTLKKVVPFTLSANVTRPTCKQSNGTIQLSVSPGLITDYTFTGGLTAATTSNLAAGSYQVTVTNTVSNCFTDTTIVMTSPADFTLAATFVKPLCGLNSGEIDLFVTPSPNSIYTFTGDLSSDINKNLASGTYNVKVTNKTTSCALDTALVLGNSTDFGITATVTEPSCSKNDGAIVLNVTPGTNADYDFTGDFTSSTLTSLGEGTYKAIVTRKSTSCFKDTLFTIKTKVPFAIAATTKDPSCNQADGSITFTSPIGSNFVYTGELTQASTTGLAADTFSVRITDITTGCIKDTSVILKNQVDFTVTASVTKPVCSQSNGVIALKVDPSIATYTFGGDFSSDSLKNLSSGIYHAIITKAGTTCSKDTTFVLGNQTTFSVSAAVTEPSCSKADGAIRLKINPSPNTDYTFGGDFTSDSLLNIGGGSYRVLVTLKNTTCTKDTLIVVNSKPDFSIASATVSPSCNKSDGAIFINITPSPVSNYTITGDLIADTTRSLAAGTYNIRVVRNSTTCGKDTSIVLTVPNVPKVELGKNDTICTDRAVVLKAKLTDSLNVAYTYKWFAGKDSLTTLVKFDTVQVQPVSTTTYTVYVSDGVSCPGIDTVQLVKPAFVQLYNTSRDFSDETKVELSFKVTNPVDLGKDSIYVYRINAKPGSTWKILDSLSRTDTVYSHTASTDSIYYYRVGLPKNNVCKASLLSRTQRIIKINGRGDEDLETSYLDWNTFVRWDSAVYEYQIWRSLDGGPFNFYNTGNLDSLANYINASDGRKQCYRIKAIEQGVNGHESWSNTVCLNFLNELRVYNIFTPNGDGHNDFLFFKNLHFYPGNELHVFNRWGNKVFHQVNYNNDWDGGDLPAGTYFYMLDLKDGSKVRQGDVLLHR